MAAMQAYLRFVWPILLLAGAAMGAKAAADPILDLAERHVRQQTQGLPGKVDIRMGRLDIQRQLPPCSAHEAFTPPGARLWGKTSIGVRCLGPSTWSILVPVDISVTTTYVTTARPLPAGHVLQADDLVTISGDLASQPTGIITDAANAIGKTLKNPLAAGQSVRGDQLLAPWVIRQGQSVRLISAGTGFSVSSEGKALNNAAAGQVAQIRLPTGQVVSAIARPDGHAEVSF